MVDKVTATPAALALIAVLQQQHGEIFFHQSGGCRFYIGANQYATWKHTQLIIDVLEGHGGGTFSLEGPLGKAFHTRSRLFTKDELAALGLLP